MQTSDWPKHTPRCCETRSRKVQRAILAKIVDSEGGVGMCVSGESGVGKRTEIYSALEKMNMNITVVDAQELVTAGDVDTDLVRKMLRSAMQISVNEHFKIIEGEVVTLSSSKLHLKTKTMESVFNIGVRIYKELERERIGIGDVIRVYKECGFVKRLGRSTDKCAGTKDLLQKVQVPDGECIRVEKVTTELELDELDVINCREGGNEYLSTDIKVCEYVCKEVDKSVLKMLAEGKAEIRREGVIIEGCELLEKSGIEEILRVASGPLVPYLFLLFNQNTMKHKFGCLHIHFDRYSSEELQEILRWHMKTNEISFEEEALKCLHSLAVSSGLDTTIRLAAAATEARHIGVDSVKRILATFDMM